MPKKHRQSSPKTDARVDVCIPAHGRPHYLIEAIESVFAQTLSDWKVLISEDGKGGGEIEEAVAPYLTDPRVSYLSTGENVGAARNMTELVRRGSAPFVTILHDDDLLCPDFLAHHVDFLEKHPQAGWVFSLVRIVDESGRELRSPAPHLAAGLYTSEELVPRLMRTNFVEGAALVKRVAYETVGSKFDEQFERIYDWDMFLRLATHFTTGHLHAREYVWRRHGAQSTFEGRLRGDEKLRFLDHSEAEVRKALPNLRLSKRHLARTRSRTYLMRAIDALEKNEPRGAVREVGKALRIYPPSIFDPQTTLVGVGVIGGRRVRRAIGDLRLEARRRSLKIHLGK